MLLPQQLLQVQPSRGKVHVQFCDVLNDRASGASPAYGTISAVPFECWLLLLLLLPLLHQHSCSVPLCYCDA